MKHDYAAQCRFFTAEDACRIALQAYYAASRAIEPPPGEAWMDEDGCPWSSATDFADTFVAEADARISLLCLEKLGQWFVTSDRWNIPKLASLIDPEKMAPIMAEQAEQDAHVEAVYEQLRLNRLPPSEDPAHNASDRGEDNAV